MCFAAYNAECFCLSNLSMCLLHMTVQTPYIMLCYSVMAGQLAAKAMHWWTSICGTDYLTRYSLLDALHVCCLHTLLSILSKVLND